MNKFRSWFIDRIEGHCVVRVEDGSSSDVDIRHVLLVAESTLSMELTPAVKDSGSQPSITP